MDINGLGSNYSDYYNSLASNAVSSGLSSKLNGVDTKNATDEELMDACKQFESYFLEQVFKEMDKTVMKANEDEGASGQLVDFFKEQSMAKMAQQSTESNPLGLAQMLYDQMRRNMGVSVEELAQNAAESGITSEE